MGRFATALVAAALAIAAPASATTPINYSVTGADATGTFTLNFDSSTSSYSLTSLDLIASTPFTQANSALFEKNSTLFSIGNGAVDGTHSFVLFFNPALTSQTQTITYADAGENGLQNGNVTISQVSPTSGVPEPATWAMMLLGFGGIGVAMRRSKRRSRALMQIA